MRTRRLRWFQFGLRALLGVVTIICVAGWVAWRAYVAPYEQQRQAMLLVEKLRGRYEAEPVDAWLGRFFPGGFQNVSLVELGHCDDPSLYLDAIVRLPELKVLVVGGDAFTDAELQQLQGVSSLQGLVLDSTSVTDAGVGALQQAMPELDIHRSYQRAWTRFLRKFQPVKRVRFGDTVPGHDGLKTKLPYAQHFQVIAAIDSAQADDASLADIGRITTLQELVLNNTPITDAGLEHFTGLAKLIKLSLVGTQVTPAGVAKLRKVLPACEIRE